MSTARFSHHSHWPPLPHSQCNKQQTPHKTSIKFVVEDKTSATPAKNKHLIHTTKSKITFALVPWWSSDLSRKVFCLQVLQLWDHQHLVTSSTRQYRWISQWKWQEQSKKNWAWGKGKNAKKKFKQQKKVMQNATGYTDYNDFGDFFDTIKSVSVVWNYEKKTLYFMVPELSWFFWSNKINTSLRVLVIIKNWMLKRMAFSSLFSGMNTGNNVHNIHFAMLMVWVYKWCLFNWN